jgi:cellulose synthase/poly-beta-1,6-N-acetylglucosamine synthase-like glycosyltransferase
MVIAKYFLLALYVIALLSLFAYGANCYFLMLHYRLQYSSACKRRERLWRQFYETLPHKGWPHVTIQLPIFNERYVVERLIKSACQIEYPKELLEIQVLDDSTDDCVTIARSVVAKMRAQGFDIVHITRSRRAGYKAGALREGLKSAKGELVGIFDADFVPGPDFLMGTIPYFSDARVGMVQTRWGHLNCDYSLLTRAQSIGIDGHFGVEQAARSWGRLFMNFNGTAGIWRKEAIEDAGGWQADTLTEDLDLSYRAQLRGWRLEFAPSVVCPSELPVTITAFKSQQHRWAKGSIQTALKLMGRIFTSDISLFVKVQAFFHLTHYMVHPFMLLVVLTSIPVLYTGWFSASMHYPMLVFALFCLATFGPSAMYLFSQRILYSDWKRRIKYLPFLMCLGTGIAVNNTKAVLEALFGIRSGFVRTPKYGIENRSDCWQDKFYRLPFNPLAVVELFLGLYSLTGFILFVLFGKYLISPFLFIYTTGFFYSFSLSIGHAYGYAKKN